jgi:hypothetical protein
MDAAEFEFRLEGASKTLSNLQGSDIVGLRIERAKVVAYARDEATAERFGIPRENTYAALIERGGGRAARGELPDEAALRSGAGRTGAEARVEGASAAGERAPHEAGVPDLREAAHLEDQRLVAALGGSPGPVPGALQAERAAGYARERDQWATSSRAASSRCSRSGAR